MSVLTPEARRALARLVASSIYELVPLANAPQDDAAAVANRRACHGDDRRLGLTRRSTVGLAVVARSRCGATIAARLIASHASCKRHARAYARPDCTRSSSLAETVIPWVKLRTDSQLLARHCSTPTVPGHSLNQIGGLRIQRGT